MSELNGRTLKRWVATWQDHDRYGGVGTQLFKSAPEAHAFAAGLQRPVTVSEVEAPYASDAPDEVWINIYREGFNGHGVAHPTKEAAARCAAENRIACIRYTRAE